jgi:hypothetical protein
MPLCKTVSFCCGTKKQFQKVNKAGGISKDPQVAAKL